MEDEKKIIRHPSEMYSHVMLDYHNNDAELNSLYFDFDVCMSKADIITMYALLQLDINGDVIVRVENGMEKEDLIPVDNDGYNEIYEGNCREFLEHINDNGEIFRRYDEEEQLDFIL